MARNKVPYRATLTNGMYKVKKIRAFDKSTSELEALVKKEVKEANRRLKQLERPIDLNKAIYNLKTKRYERPNQIIFTTDKGKKKINTTRLKSFKGLYAAKGLEERDLLDKKGRVRFTGKETRTELISIHSELSSFLKNTTSTRKGIRKVFESTKDTLGLNLDVEPEEAETLYNFFVDPDFKGVQEYIKGSDFMYIMNYSVNRNADANSFIDVIKDYISEDKANKLNSDLNMQDKLRRIYSKYLNVKL